MKQNNNVISYLKVKSKNNNLGYAFLCGDIYQIDNRVLRIIQDAKANNEKEYTIMVELIQK